MKKVFWKRALAALLAVCLVTVFVPDALPRAAAADSEVHTHADDPDAEWIPLTLESQGEGEKDVLKAGETLVNNNRFPEGHYYLAEDMTLSGATTAGGFALYFAGTSVLCLNGHILDGKVYAESECDLTICDCGDDGAITRTSSSAAYIKSGGTLHLLSGTLSSKDGSGGGDQNVYVGGGGTFEMRGGTVSATNQNGVSGRGTIVISGGTITSNRDAVQASGAFTLSGSPVIIGGEAKDTASIYLGEDTLINLKDFTGAPHGQPYTVRTPDTSVHQFAEGAVSTDADSFVPRTAGLVTEYREGGELWFGEHVHQWDKGWTYNDKKHWHVCLGAGACGVDKYEAAEHTADPDEWKVDEATDQHYKTCSVCGAEFSRADHEWEKGEVAADGTRVDTCKTCKATRTVTLCGISGKVTTEAEEPVVGATVALKQGKNQVGESVTDTSGAYTFSNVNPGVYNVVATVDGKTVTILVTVSDAALQDQDLVVPQSDVSSALTVSGSSAPDIVVDGLQAEAVEQAEDNVSVSVTMSITCKDMIFKPDVEAGFINDEVRGGFTEAEKEEIDLRYFEIDVKKEVTTTAGATTSTKTENIGETKHVLTIVIPYSMGGRTNVAVHRYHDSAVEKLERLWSEPSEPEDGTFRADLEHNLIYIYANKFSTYAISSTNGNNAPEKEPEPVQENVNPYYPVAVPANPNGTVSVSPTSAAAGMTVTVTVTPSEGYVLDTLKVTQVGTGTAVEVTAGADGTYTFAMPAGGATVTAAFKEKEQEVEPPVCPSEQFTDIEETAWYYDAVDYVVEKGLMDGVDDTTFAPNDSTTRAMLVTILYRLDGEPAVTKNIPFSDVASGLWYSDAINWAAANEIVGGYGDDTFCPDRDLTREEAATILYRYASYKKYDVTTTAALTGYTDAASVRSYATAPMSWAVGTELINGTTATTLAPNGGAIRAQIATILMRFCENVVK